MGALKGIFRGSLNFVDKLSSSKYKNIFIFISTFILFFAIYTVIENLPDSTYKIYNYNSLKQLNILMNTYYKVEEIDFNNKSKNQRGFIQAKILVVLRNNFIYSDKNSNDYIIITFLDSKGFKIFSTSLKFSDMNKIVEKNQVIGFIYNDKIFNDFFLYDKKYFS